MAGSLYRLLRQLSVGIALALCAQGHAATIKVDGTACGLADAITAANLDQPTGGCRGGSGADQLRLVAKTYILTRVDNERDGPNGLPSIVSTITINGDPDRDGVGAVIRRSAMKNTAAFRLFHVDQGGQLTLNRVTLRNGWAPMSHSGGALFNAGVVVLRNCRLAHNRGTGNGGAVFNTVGGGGDGDGGKASLIGTTVADNATEREGGGVANVGTLVLRDSRVMRNTSSGRGGGLLNRGLTRLDRSRVHGNSASDGGGIANDGEYHGEMRLTRSIISANHAAFVCGGILNSHDGSLILSHSTVSHNVAEGTGGGLCVVSSESMVIDSTVSSNVTRASGGNDFLRAGAGGILVEGGKLTLVNSTVSGNRTPAPGYGVAGIDGYFGTITIENSLIANSVNGSDCGSERGTLTLSGMVLIEDGSCMGLHRLSGILTGDPRLGPLLDNGGATPTHALRADSPVIDLPAKGRCLKDDQRGVTRPQGERCDVGAFEHITLVPPAVADLIALFDESVRNQTLIGRDESRASQQAYLEAFRNQLLVAGNLAAQGLMRKACDQLATARSHLDTHGIQKPQDYVHGPGVADLDAKIKATQSTFLCG